MMSWCIEDVLLLQLKGAKESITGWTYLHFFDILLALGQGSDDNVLFHTVAFFKSVLVRPCNTIAFPVSTISIHSLKGVELLWQGSG